MKGETQRGQSAVVSTLLLTGIVLILSATTAWAFFGMSVPILGSIDGGSATATPVVSMGFEADEGGVSVTHTAGTGLPTEELALVVRSEGANERVSFADMSETAGNGDDRFESGETYDLSTALSGYADVRVVHEPTGTVLFRGTATVGPGGASGPPALDFDAASVSSYEPQDSSGSVTSSGSTIEMSGNTWKAVEYPYTVTSDTVLVFEFRSDIEGEIHGVAFDENKQFSGSDGQFFQLYGTDPDRSGWDPIRDYDTYSDGDGWKTYTIPVGQHYTGDMNYLVFANDHDNGAKNGASAYRNVRVYEAN